MTLEPNAEQRLFAEAIELASDEERTAFLRKACGDDTTLKQGVEALLRACFTEENFIQPLVPDDVEREATVIIEGPGTVIGHYKLLERIGEGGFGVVYLAAQEEPVRRQVALKIIKLGMDTRQVIARFEAERQALAMMDHPNIAKVLDAGATETGRPYFVMELVRGLPITQFCEENRLPLKERLELFLRVCHAIQHAHQKGVIHRDIKPSNVLVTMNDGVPHPMVIDFGVAKAIAEPLTDKTLYTRFAQMIGTPAYMSPEQAEMSKQDVDTRSDVYSLGILLYELLTGSTPFPEKRLREAGFAEIQRIITTEEPERPSTRLTRLLGSARGPACPRPAPPPVGSGKGPRTGGEAGFDEGVESRPRGRVRSPLRRRRSLNSDLDWIVLKAIEKDRNRRYETANGLAADIQRYLANEPVTAKPPSAAYRLSKFVQRNRVGVLAAAAVAVTLLLATILSTALAIRAIQAERGMSEEKERTAKEARRASRNLYFAEIKLANQAIAEQNPGHALKLLERYIPAEDTAESFRGWEWYYLWNQVRPDPSIELGTHETEIRSVAFSPSGELAASSDYAGGISVWEVPTHRRSYHGKEGAIVNEVRFFSEDILLAGDDSGNLTFHNIRKGDRIRKVGLPAAVRAISLSPQQDQLAVLIGGPEAPAKTIVWSLAPASPEQPVATLTLAHTMESPASGFWPYIAGALAYSPTGRELAVGEVSGTVRVYDCATGALSQTLRAHATQGAVATLAFSPGGQWLAANGQRGEADDAVVVWDTRTWEEVAVLRGHARMARSLAFSHGNDFLLVASGDQLIRQWNTTDWSLRRTFLGHRGPLNCLALAPSGARVISAGVDASVLLWQLTESNPRLEPIVLPQLRGFEFSPTSGLLATIEGGAAHPHFNRVLLRVPPDYQVRTDLPLLGGQVRDTAFSSDGRLLAGLSVDAVRIWDMDARQVSAEGTLPASDSRVLAGFSADAEHLLLVDRYHRVTVWNLQEETIQNTWSTRREECPPMYFDNGSLAFHAPSNTLVLGGFGSASVWDTETRTCRGSLKGHGIWYVEPAISPDGGLIATLGEEGDRQVRLWDRRTLQQVGQLGTPSHPILCPAFSPDRRRLVIGRYKYGDIGIYDSETGIEILRIPSGITEISRHTQWSPDGSTLVVAGSGGGVIWRTSSRDSRQVQP
ncbi:MAG: protein kinase [Verrucomicrobiales bacterium]|nr:protein kinase [Verrucomicrobiales bacterium]